MDLYIWGTLVIAAILFTVLMLVLEDYAEIRGFGMVLAIISLIFWVVVALTSIDLSTTYVVIVSDAVQEYTVRYPDTWPLALFFALASVFSLIMILKKIPETWPEVAKE